MSEEEENVPTSVHEFLRPILVELITKVAQKACRNGESGERKWPPFHQLLFKESWKGVGEQYADETYPLIDYALGQAIKGYRHMKVDARLYEKLEEYRKSLAERDVQVINQKTYFEKELEDRNVKLEELKRRLAERDALAAGTQFNLDQISSKETNELRDTVQHLEEELKQKNEDLHQASLLAEELREGLIKNQGQIAELRNDLHNLNDVEKIRRENVALREGQKQLKDHNARLFKENEDLKEESKSWQGKFLGLQRSQKEKIQDLELRVKTQTGNLQAAYADVQDRQNKFEEAHSQYLSSQLNLQHKVEENRVLRMERDAYAQQVSEITVRYQELGDTATARLEEIEALEEKVAGLVTSREALGKDNQRLQEELGSVENLCQSILEYVQNKNQELVNASPDEETSTARKVLRKIVDAFSHHALEERKRKLRGEKYKTELITDIEKFNAEFVALKNQNKDLEGRLEVEQERFNDLYDKISRAAEKCGWKRGEGTSPTAFLDVYGETSRARLERVQEALKGAGIGYGKFSNKVEDLAKYVGWRASTGDRPEPIDFIKQRIDKLNADRKELARKIEDIHSENASRVEDSALLYKLRENVEATAENCGWSEQDDTTALEFLQRKIGVDNLRLQNLQKEVEKLRADCDANFRRFQESKVVLRETGVFVLEDVRKLYTALSRIDGHEFIEQAPQQIGGLDGVFKLWRRFGENPLEILAWPGYEPFALRLLALARTKVSA